MSLDRIRASVLERGFVSLMREAGVAERLDAGGFMHQDTQVSFGDTMFSHRFQRAHGVIQSPFMAKPK